jgi:hypothetical protein
LRSRRKGAYDNIGVRSVFTYGFGMGLARNDKRDLRTASDDVIAAVVFHNLRQNRTFDYTSVTIGDRPRSSLRPVERL